LLLFLFLFAMISAPATSGWRRRSLQSKQKRFERAVSKGYYKPARCEDPPLLVDDHMATGIIAQWKSFKAGDTKKRWADLDDICDDSVEPPSFLGDFFDASDVAVEVPTLVCPPPPPPLD
jgi:hypothetical protein